MTIFLKAIRRCNQRWQARERFNQIKEKEKRNTGSEKEWQLKQEDLF
jgi:hypothetical protein